MGVLVPTCAAILALYGVVRFASAEDRRAVAVRLLLLAVAAWIAEDTAVRAYGFYSYSSHLGPVVDRVPVLVALIWSVVIDSAWEIAGHIVGRSHPRLPLAASAIVLADASLIEPVAVRAGLWSWTEPGLFAVPPIGILGWSFFTAACLWALPRLARRGHPAVTAVGLWVIAPVLTHAALVLAWWTALRWVSAPIPGWAAAAVAWTVLPVVGIVSFRRELRRRVPRVAMLVRAPAAVFFYVLLVVFGRDDLALVAYGAAFVWPYLAVIDVGRTRTPSARGSPVEPLRNSGPGPRGDVAS